MMTDDGVSHRRAGAHPQPPGEGQRRRTSRSRRPQSLSNAYWPATSQRATRAPPRRPQHERLQRLAPQLWVAPLRPREPTAACDVFPYCAAVFVDLSVDFDFRLSIFSVYGNLYRSHVQACNSAPRLLVC